METLDIKSLYNWEVKQHFIEDITDNEGTRRTLYFNFKRIAAEEKKHEKDIYEMPFEIIEKILNTAKFKTENSVRAFISNITTYTEWCSENGYRASNLPKLPSESITSMAHKYVSKVSSVYYTQDQLMDYYDKLHNVGDVLVLQCIFEGIRGQASSEIFNLKIDDVFEKDGKYYVNLYDSEKGEARKEPHEITEFLYDLMFKVDSKKFIDDIKGRPLELIPSDYILKKTAKGNVNSNNIGEPLQPSYLTNKLKQFREIFENNKFRYKDIEKSGVMHYLHELMKNKENNVATPEEYKLISDKFNIGKYMHSFYEQEVVNYSAIKGLIDLKFYNEHYGEIELS